MTPIVSCRAEKGATMSLQIDINLGLLPNYLVEAPFQILFADYFGAKTLNKIVGEYAGIFAFLTEGDYSICQFRRSDYVTGKIS
jgi:hypothetical protein